MSFFSIKDKSRYIEVTVHFKIENKGKIKSERVQFLVDAMTVTEAESKTIAHLKKRGETVFDVKATNPSKIAEVIS